MVDLWNLIRTFAFGIFLVLAFFSALYVFWRKGKEEHYEEDALFDLALGATFWALIGARLGFILTHLPDFGLNVLRWFSLAAYPGYLGFTGLFAGLVALVIAAKQRKLDLYELADFGVIAVSLASVWVSVGMFINGAGFGNPTTLPIGLTFPGVFDKRHPVQLYMGALYLVLFFLLWRLESIYRTFLWYRENRRTAQTGFLFGVFCLGYGCIGLGLLVVRAAAFTLYGFPIDAVIYAGAMIYGFATLYVRSGRTFMLFKKKVALHPQA